jgi:serine/threonine protein kinase
MVHNQDRDAAFPPEGGNGAFIPSAEGDTGDFKPVMSDTQVPAVRLPSKYTCIRELGGGGMGKVYLVRDKTLDRDVALKIPKQGYLNDEVLRRFSAEATAGARLRHRNICEIYEYDEFEKQRYFTMTYVDGQTLAQFAKTPESMLPYEAARIVHTLAAALEFVHKKGVIHRDLKPSNVMIENGSNEIYITDFGLAKIQGQSELFGTRDGQVLGTVLYMAPEQGAGRHSEVGPWSDVYSLGVILYELLTGILPFATNSNKNIIDAKLASDPEPPIRHRPDLDSQLNRICLRAIARDLRKRHQSMADLASDLIAWLKAHNHDDPSTILSPETPVQSPPSEKIRIAEPARQRLYVTRKRAVLTLVIASVASLLGAMAIWHQFGAGRAAIVLTEKRRIESTTAKWANEADKSHATIQLTRDGSSETEVIRLVRVDAALAVGDGKPGPRSRFWIACRPTTEREFKLVTGVAIKQDLQHAVPITGVNWFQANDYCGKLQKLLSQQGVALQVRLPTVRQWVAAPPDVREQPGEFGEWTIDFAYPEIPAGGTEPSSPHRLVCKGTERPRHEPGFQSTLLGFRIIVEEGS